MRGHIIKRGLTLIETVLALVIGLAVIGGVLVYFNQARSENEASEYYNYMMLIHSAVHSIYSNSTNYDGFSEKILANSGFMNKYAKDEKVYTPDKEEIDGVGAFSFQGRPVYNYRFYGFSYETCTNLAVSIFSLPDLANINLNGHDITYYKGINSELIKYCSSNSGTAANQLIVVFW